MGKYEYCYECDKDVISKIKCEKKEYTYRDKNITVMEEVHYCPNCNNILLNESIDKSLNKVYDEYLKIYGLSFDKIKKIRKNLNLSQEAMAKILGWGERSIIRYENATSIPQGEYLNMYITLNENPFYIIKILEKKKNNFSEEEYYKFLKLLPFFNKYKTINAILYLLNNNTMYETSLMKNLFALDFESYKKYNMPVTDLKYVHMNYGPVVDKRENLYNFLIANNYIKLETTDFKYGNKFQNVFGCDEKIFNNEEMELLKIVKNKLKKYSATYLSNWSHNFKGWKDTKNGNIIDYKYASYFDINEL